jgi:hypothetical protein
VKLSGENKNADVMRSKNKSKKIRMLIFVSEMFRVNCLISFLILFLMVGCSYHKTKIKPFDTETVDSVIVTTKSDDNINYKKLSSEQVAELINQINAASDEGLWKFVSGMSIAIYEDGTKRELVTNADHFKIKAEQGDETFKIPDSTFFELLKNP